MAISDLWKKKEPAQETLMVEHGTTGTEIMSGMIQEEYNNELAFPESIIAYDEMRKSDGAVAALLRSIKQPLVSAEWEVQAAGEDDKDKEIASFIERNLFEKISFQKFLKEALGYLDFGFYYFEKIYEVKNGMIEWKSFAPRIPRSHYLWTINGQEWIDGHPPGVTQQINTTDEKKTVLTHPTIPWNKLVLFSNDQEGNNFEGVSILRPAYKHYFYKDLLYKIGSISSERYGVGVPTAQVKSSMQKPNRDKMEEALKNIRSNEKAFVVYTDDVVKMEIMTPNGTGVGSQIKEQIDHHNKQIYDSILAGFLNLTSGEGGSNALSKDQSSFFLRGLQGVADYFCEVMNQQIKELVDMNYNGIEKYPILVSSEIGQTSMDENISAINTAVAGGLVALNEADRVAVRSILKLPVPPPPDDEDIEIQQMEADLALEAMQIGSLGDFGAPAKPDDTAKPEDQETELTQEDIDDVLLGKPLTEEHKKKIAEALKKGGGASTMERQSSSDAIDNDPVTAKYQADKERLVGMLDNLKTAMADLKEKKSGMSKEQKKKFAGEFKAQLAQLTESRKSLQAIGKDLSKKIQGRKKEVRSITKEVNKQITTAKKAEKAKEKADREAEKAAKKKNLSDRIDEMMLELAEEDKKKVPTKREVAFTGNITSFEKYLEGKYSEVDSIISDAEKEYRDALLELYDNSESTRVDGVTCLVYDKTRITAGKNKIAKITAKLEKKLIDSELQNEIFTYAKNMSVATMTKNEEMNLSWSLDVPQGQVNTFIEGYKSNMQGVIFNESRRVLENITLNYGSEASIDLAKKTASEFSFNRNILALSFVTHPRALYKYIIYDGALASGYTMFKPIVPTNKLQNVIDRPFGMTASIIFTIMTAAQINKAASAMTGGKTAEAVTGLGLHHGSFEYYYPIESVDIDTEEEIAKMQREELKKKSNS